MGLTQVTPRKQTTPRKKATHQPTESEEDLFELGLKLLKPSERIVARIRRKYELEKLRADEI